MSFSTEARTELNRLRDEIRRGARIVSIGGLTSISAKAFVLSQLQRETGKTFAVVAETNKELETWAGDLNFWSGQRSAVSGQPDDNSALSTRHSALLTLPSFETDVYSGISPHAETQEERALTLWKLTHAKAQFVLTSAKALITKTVAPQEIKNYGAFLRRDEDFAPERLIQNLTSCGYVREEPIYNYGQFSMRGGIVDVWSPDAENPVRIEFFGDSVESIREFDAATQLSVNQIQQVRLAPMREFCANEKDFKDWAFFARDRFSDEKFERNLKDRTDFAAEGETFSGWEFLISLINPRKSNLFDYLPETVFVIDEPTVIEQTLASFYENLTNRYAETQAADDVALAPEELFLNVEQLREALSRNQRVELRALGLSAAETDEEFQISDNSSSVVIGQLGNQESTGDERPATDNKRKPLFLFSTAEKPLEFEIQSRSTRKFHGNVREFAGELNRRDAETQSLPEGRRTKDAGRIVVLQSQGLAERLTEILRDYDAHLAGSSLLVGDLSNGFEIPSLDLIVQTETDIFGETTQGEFQRPKTKDQRPKTKLGAFISDFRDLKPGDYVVHVDHGIGRFEGLQTIESQGIQREFMLLIYADNAKLFVPVERLDLVSRYSSGEATQPTLDRLGGIGWQKTKAKAKRAMRDMADELLRLYAERKLVQGFAFSADSPWQEEFEDAFPFELTPDQSTTIEAVKSDMETLTPMDRLIVGDVGYGKTEVAMRAAFKAVMDSKQVAILAPTTVLAYQHFE
ncbi:MAG TPA: CarD family transcriptional regulator, partial [Pyrinomonadaceae bacterium]